MDDARRGPKASRKQGGNIARSEMKSPEQRDSLPGMASPQRAERDRRQDSKGFGLLCGDWRRRERAEESASPDHKTWLKKTKLTAKECDSICPERKRSKVKSES